MHRNGTIFYKSVQFPAYTDDIDIIERTMRDVTASFSAIERESTKMGLAVNEGKVVDELGRASYGVSVHS